MLEGVGVVVESVVKLLWCSDWILLTPPPPSPLCRRPSVWSTKTRRVPFTSFIRRDARIYDSSMLLLLLLRPCVTASTAVLTSPTFPRASFASDFLSVPPPPHRFCWSVCRTQLIWKIHSQVDRVKDSGPISESYTTENLMSVVYVPLVNT